MAKMTKGRELLTAVVNKAIAAGSPVIVEQRATEYMKPSREVVEMAQAMTAKAQHTPGPFRVGGNYIDWAHGPGADDQQPAALELCNLPENKRGQVEVPADRADLVREIASVAELYVGGRDTDLRAASVLKRARAWLAGAQK